VRPLIFEDIFFKEEKKRHSVKDGCFFFYRITGRQTKKIFLLSIKKVCCFCKS
jgi:hypothetical protein